MAVAVAPQALDAYLRGKASPLAGLGNAFVQTGAQYGVDPRALVAISGGETGFGTYKPSQGIHNPFGIGPNKAFPSYQASIDYLGKLLSGPTYAGRGATTIPAISGIYAPPGAGNDPHNLNANWTRTQSQFLRELGGDPTKPIVGLPRGGVQTQAEVGAPATGAPMAAGGLSPALMGSLQKWLATSSKQAAAGTYGGGLLSSPLLKQLVAARAQAPTGEVAKGYAPATAPPVSGRSGVATQAALQELGVPYSWGGGSPSGPTTGISQGAGIKGFDCSALVQYAWAKAGVQIPRTTYDQMKVGTSVPNLASAAPGDLLFPHPGHVMMYLGNGQAVESPHTGAAVHVVSVAGQSFQTIRRPG
jgi:cell wall-associated NlpC family hydrolase